VKVIAPSGLVAGHSGGGVGGSPTPQNNVTGENVFVHVGSLSQVTVTDFWESQVQCSRFGNTCDQTPPLLTLTPCTMPLQLLLIDTVGSQPGCGGGQPVIVPLTLI
jgi:hypothetical protein